MKRPELLSLGLLATVVASCSGSSASPVAVNPDSSARSQAVKFSALGPDRAAEAFVACVADDSVSRDYIVRLDRELRPLFASQSSRQRYETVADSITNTLPADKRAAILVKLVGSPAEVAYIVALDDDRDALERAVISIYSSTDKSKLDQYKNSLLKSE